MRNRLLLGLALALLLAPAAAAAQSQTCNAIAQAGGTANAITIPLLPCAQQTNLLVLALTQTNTSTVTLKQGSLPALPVQTASGAGLAPGGLVGGSYVLLTSTGTSWRLLANPSPQANQVLGTVITYSSTPVVLSPLTYVAVINVNAASAVSFPNKSNWPNCSSQVASCPEITVVDGSGLASLNAITLSTVDGTTFDGLSSAIISNNYQALTWVLDGTANVWRLQ